MEQLPRLDLADDATIAQWYAFGAGRTVRSNMVMGLDGAAVDGAGLAAGLSGRQDTRLLGLLRGLADAVVVGAGTVRAEGYNPIRARASLRDLRAAAGMAEHPVLVVVTRTPTLDPRLPTFVAAPRRPVVLCAVDNGSLAGVADVVQVPGADGGVDLVAGLAALADRGHRRIHTEGGPHLLGSLVAAGLLDEYCLTLSPRLAGGPPGLLRPVLGPTAPTGYGLVHAATADGFLFLRYRRSM
jgi:riboflavin biosynthesis pyrimidine reductase